MGAIAVVLGIFGFAIYLSEKNSLEPQGATRYGKLFSGKLVCWQSGDKRTDAQELENGPGLKNAAFPL
nr:hypothetical protein [uncultured Cohaesibacter sp.]